MGALSKTGEAIVYKMLKQRNVSGSNMMTSKR
jgi:hypothetical protein